MEIPKNLKDEIWEYCRLNDITDLNAFMLKSLQQGFNIEKYGPTPFTVGDKEPEIIEKEIEKIVEVVKEVPVEVIKEIEKIVEVPVEVIKEVIVEKPVEVIKEVVVSDDESVNKLQKELDSIKVNERVHLKSLRDKVKKLKEKDVEISDLNRKISDLVAQILQLKSELNELGGKTTELEEELEEERKKVSELSDDKNIKSLTQKIENLKIELELEKNRHYQPPKKERPKEDNKKGLRFGNIISWVSKDEREDEKDIYGE
jgi:chromosome segregation ATPase